MYRDHSVGVVVPAYNEAGFVGEVIETIPDYVDRVYAVDDCSTDCTWEEIREAARRPVIDAAVATPDGGAAVTSRVEPIRHEENRGVGGAIKTGYLAAAEDGMDVVAVMGGDGQMDPEYLDRLLDPIVDGRADYVKGNRLLEPDDHAEMPRHRLVGNGVLTVLTKIATGYWQIGDPQMGYTAISREAIEGAGVEDMYEYYGYCNDLLVRLSESGYRVADVPCPLGYGDETSHISYAEYVPRVSAMLLRSFLRRLWVDRDSPSGALRLGLFLGGAALTVVGLLTGLSGVRSAAESETPPEPSDAASPAVSGAATADASEGTVPDPSESAAPSASKSAAPNPSEGATLDTRERVAPNGSGGATQDWSTPEPTTGATSSEPSGSTDPSDPNPSGRFTGRGAALALLGVAGVLGGMLVDVVTSAPLNYKERVPEDET